LEFVIGLRKRRGVEADPLFGDLRHNRLVRRFHRRGLKKIDHELGLHGIAHNLRKNQPETIEKGSLIALLFNLC